MSLVLWIFCISPEKLFTEIQRLQSYTAIRLEQDADRFFMNIMNIRQKPFACYGAGQVFEAGSAESRIALQKNSRKARGPEPSHWVVQGRSITQSEPRQRVSFNRSLDGWRLKAVYGI